MNELDLFAKAIAGSIRRGMTGNTFALLARMRLGMAYVRIGAQAEPEAVLAQFKEIPPAWASIEPVLPKFEAFWRDAQAAFVKMVESADKASYREPGDATIL